MKPNLDTKTKQILSYFVYKYTKEDVVLPSITSLIKLSYLFDLVCLKNGLQKATTFEYVRYYYGPYDSSINVYVDELVKDGIFNIKTYSSVANEEYVVFEFNKSKEEDLDLNLINDTEKEYINGLFLKIKGFGAKMLTEIAYQTKPMTKIGAKLGGKEHLGEKLDLSAK